MTPDAAVVAILEALDAASIPYMIVGSLASNFHGVPRATRDAGFIVELPAGALDRLSKALPSSLSLGAQGALRSGDGHRTHTTDGPE